MDPVCPLCRSGRLTLSTRTLDFEGRTFSTSAHQCSTCRETLVGPEALDDLKRAILAEGLGATDAELDAVVERLLLRAE